MKPQVLLIPGVLCDATVWTDVAQGLQHDAIVRVAMPQQSSISAMAEAAWSALEGVPPEAPVVLAGFSLGGYVVLEMLAGASRGTRPVRAAALVSTSPRPESPEAAAVRVKTIAAMERDFPRFVEGLLQFTLHEPTPAVVARLRAMMLHVGPEVAIRQNRAIIERADHRAALAALQLPVAVLCGAQDRVTPPELSREAAALLPQARLEIVEGAGHMLPAERPESVARALRALLH